MSDSPPPLVKPSKNNVSKCSSGVAILSPLLKEPFKKGWRREVVYRSTVDSERRNLCDIYYFSPDGKKLRSKPDVLKYLNGSKSCFSIKNFSFFKEPIGMDDDQEICRYAGTKSSWCEGVDEQIKKAQKKNISRVKNSFPTPSPKVLENNVGAVTTIMTRKRSRDGEKVPSNPVFVEDRSKRRVSLRKTLQKTKLQDPLSAIKATSTKSSPILHAISDNISLPTKSDDESTPSGSVHNTEDNTGSSVEDQEKVETSVQQPATGLPAAAVPFPETLPLNSPLIGLLPLGTTLVLSDPSTLRIIPSCTISTSVKEIEKKPPDYFNIPEPIPSLPSSVKNSVVADLSKTKFRKPDTSKKIKLATLPSSPSVNNRKLRSNKELATATISSPKTSSSVDRFVVLPSPSDYNQRSIPGLGLLGNQKRSYWISIGKAIIEEGLQNAIRSNTSATVGDNPISVTPISEKVRDVNKAAARPVFMTCQEFFALRKQKREQKLNPQPQTANKSIASISVVKMSNLYSSG